LETRLNLSIRFDLVALHEIGHALGLDESSDSSSIMFEFYNPGYNIHNLAHDSAAATLRSLYANLNSSPWLDSTDVRPGDGKVEISYTFDTFSRDSLAAVNSFFAGTAWKDVVRADLYRWAAASDNKVSFFEATSSSANAVHTGSADIHFGAAPIDPSGTTLGETFGEPSATHGTDAVHVVFNSTETFSAGETTSLASQSASNATNDGSSQTPSKVPAGQGKKQQLPVIINFATPVPMTPQPGVAGLVNSSPAVVVSQPVVPALTAVRQESGGGDNASLADTDRSDTSMSPIDPAVPEKQPAPRQVPAAPALPPQGQQIRAPISFIDAQAAYFADDRGASEHAFSRALVSDGASDVSVDPHLGANPGAALAALTVVSAGYWQTASKPDNLRRRWLVST
jgi:hypothetical protein